MKTTAAGLGVVLLDLDQKLQTTRCLRSLAAGSRLPNLVVVVANGRKHFEVDALAHLGRLPLVVLRPGKNLGCAGGRNLGLEYLFQHTSLARFVVLDNDTVVPADFLENVASAELDFLEVAAPVIYDLSSGTVWSSGGLTRRDGSISQLTDPIPDTAPAKEVDWAPGACLIASRETWARVGPFDAWMGFLFEDVDWCHRLTAIGGRVLLRPNLSLLHEANQSLGGKWSPKRVHLWARNGTVFRIVTMKVGLWSTTAWLATESTLAVRDLCAGKARCFLARATGLALGVWASLLRRREPSTGVSHTASHALITDSVVPGERRGIGFGASESTTERHPDPLAQRGGHHT